MSLFRVATCSLRFGAARICIPTQRVYARPIRYASGLVRGYATEKDAKVSLNDPTENEAQKLLESGTQKLEIGDVQGAMADYRQSIRVHRNASAYYNLGDLESAIQSWKEALEIAPDSPDAHTNLASAYIMSKPPQGELALSHLKYVGCTNSRTAAELSPDDGEILFNLATVLEACEQLEEAIHAYKKAKENGIDNVRNCMAKLMAARVDIEVQEQELKEKQEKEKKSHS